MKKIKRVIIGGSTNIPGWITLNADASTNPEILSDITELKGLEPNSVSVFYLSHVLEHIKLTQVIPTLSKLYEIMTNYSSLYISVPDLTVLSKLLHDPDLSIDQKIHVLRMLYGGQISEFDFHYFGYTLEILSAFLTSVGFCQISKVNSFKLHSDTSSFAPYKNIQISLNIICHKI